MTNPSSSFSLTLMPGPSPISPSGFYLGWGLEAKPDTLTIFECLDVLERVYGAGKGQIRRALNLGEFAYSGKLRASVDEGGDATCEMWLHLMSRGVQHGQLRVLAAKQTKFVRTHWGEEKICERAKHYGLSAHDVLFCLQIEVTNRAQRRARTS